MFQALSIITILEQILAGHGTNPISYFSNSIHSAVTPGGTVVGSKGGGTNVAYGSSGGPPGPSFAPTTGADFSGAKSSGASSQGGFISAFWQLIGVKKSKG